jgi:hypothetical protein
LAVAVRDEVTAPRLTNVTAVSFDDLVDHRARVVAALFHHTNKSVSSTQSTLLQCVELLFANTDHPNSVL